MLRRHRWVLHRWILLGTVSALTVISSPVAAAQAIPSSALPTGSSPASSSPAQSSAHQVPPPAPTPSDSGKSPDKPDPNPPVGGIGPNGELVGGAKLQSRGLVVPSSAPALPDGITATAWVVVDLDNGNVLAAKDPHGRYQPASILKTLTSVTLLPLLPGNRSVTVSQAAANAEGSAVGLVAGGTYTVDQLFQSLLLVSGNDAAQALAEAAGGVSHTVDLMNAEAMKLGAYDTYVQTPSGLDGWSQLTSAYDMALVLRAAVNQPRFIAYDQLRTLELPAQTVNGTTTSAFQIQNQGIPFMNGVSGALVSKIGYTDAAQHTYLAATQRDGRRIGVVFMRAQRWPLDQWQQAAKLFDWAYALPTSVSPVGHLDAAVTSIAQVRANASSAAASASAQAKAVAETRRRQWSDDVPIIAAGAILIGASALTIRRWRPVSEH